MERETSGETPSQLIARGAQAQEEATPEQDPTPENWTPEYLRRAQMEDTDI